MPKEKMKILRKRKVMPLSDTTSCDKMKRDIALSLYPKRKGGLSSRMCRPDIAH